ncbi:MAG: hypothetical protein ACKVP0_08055 [Pirellulaceae bacterium]
MASQESDREDLLREATALVERIELRLPNQPETIVAGFRRDGSASFFFGQSPVFQFNSQRELRRAFRDGLLYKTDNGRLVEMRRERTATAVELRSRVLTDEESAALCQEALTRLGELRDALKGGQAVVVGQFPDAEHGADVKGRVMDWLHQLPAEIKVAKTSRVQ